MSFLFSNVVEPILLFWKSTVLLVLLFFTGSILGGCWLIGEEEISARIRAALPSQTIFTVVASNVSLTCVAAEFVVSGRLALNDKANDLGPDKKSDLGVKWNTASSLHEYSENADLMPQKSNFDGTILHSKECLEVIGFDASNFYSKRVAVTHSSSAKEIILIFIESNRGFYLAQGR